MTPCKVNLVKNWNEKCLRIKTCMRVLMIGKAPRRVRQVLAMGKTRRHADVEVRKACINDE